MHRARVTASKQVKLTSDLCRQFAIDRKAKRRGITTWQAWGVFKVEQHIGKNPIVHIMAVPGAVVRTGRLRRVQIERLAGDPADCLVEFNDGTEAHVGWPTDRRTLREVFNSAAWADAELVDRGTGWLAVKLLPPSEEWQPLEIEGRVLP
jgi:hypothetical protein